MRNGGGIPVCVVSSQDKVDLLHEMGVEHVIDRKAEDYQFWTDDDEMDYGEIKRFGKKIRSLLGRDVDIVFEHPGRATFGASVIVCKPGGTIVTCASTSGYMHTYDNRYLWMNLKDILSSHFANYNEAYQANDLVNLGMIHPILSKTFALEDTAEAAWLIHTNQHAGKLGVLVNSPEEGLGVQDPEKRARHVDEIQLFEQMM